MDMEVESLFATTRPCTASISHTLMSDRDGTVKAINNCNEQTEDIVDLSFNIEPGEDPCLQKRQGQTGQVIRQRQQSARMPGKACRSFGENRD